MRATRARVAARRAISNSEPTGEAVARGGKTRGVRFVEMLLIWQHYMYC